MSSSTLRAGRCDGGQAAVNLRRIRAIFRKDMRDAMRDSRVLTAVLMPLLIGLLYSFIFPDNTAPKVQVGIVSPSPTQLIKVITDQVGKSARLTFDAFIDPAQLEQQVQKGKLDVGLVLPAGFDAAVRAGRAPALTVFVPSSPGAGGDYVGAVVDRSVQAMAGRAPAAQIVRRTLPPERGSSGAALDVLGVRKFFVLVAIIMLLAMIAVYAVPAVLIEETEKKTMEALTLIASTGDVIAAKALFGISLSVVSVPLLLAITRGWPKDVVELLIAVVLSAVVLVGIGLLIAGLLKNQQQVNTWSGIFLLPLLAPAFTLGLSTPGAVNAALAFLPTMYTYRLIANAFAGQTLYPNAWLSYVVLVAWGVAAYGLLWWRLSRQENG